MRTRWQHEWAEVFEKLADRVGRGIRYGEAPSHWMSEGDLATAEPLLRELYESSYGVRLTTVNLALVVADLIAAVEEAEATDPDASELEGQRRAVEEAIGRLRQYLEDI